jgi:chromosome partitioning protein
MAVRLAISSQKGGVAKTTSCISLGACLAEQGKRTLIVDLDPQSHLTLAAGLNSGELPWTIVDVLDGSQEPSPAYPTHMTGLDILPSDLRLAELEHNLFNKLEYEKQLAVALEPCQASYDTILFDCPPSLSPLTIMALTAAEWALLPVQCEYFSSHGVIQLLEIIEAVRAHTNPNLSHLLFVTLFDGRNLVSRTVLEQLRSHFAGSLLNTVIGMDTRLRECAIAGEPILHYAPKTRASSQYRSLAEEVLSRVANQPCEGVRTSSLETFARLVVK